MEFDKKKKIRKQKNTINLIVKRRTLNKVMKLYGKNMLILQNNQGKATNKTVKKVTD